MTEPDPSPYFAAEPPPAPDVKIDARGLLCPLPIVHLGKALRDAAPGAVVLVTSTDPGFFPDLLRWIRVRDAEIVALRENGGSFRAWVRQGG